LPNQLETNREHYTESYYSERYGGVYSDPAYYELLAAFWRQAIFPGSGISVDAKLLDYGCGLGQVTAALPNVTYFDVSDFAVEFLRKRGRTVVANTDEIPKRAFDVLLSSHSLEHSLRPVDDLIAFRDYLNDDGRLLLILPIEQELDRTLEPDLNQHFHCWTFQTITNLLRKAGWKPEYQRKLYGPFMLRTLAKALPRSTAVKTAVRLGKLKRWFPSMMIVSRVA
jgi:SAM-dependent methyltransferase